VRFNTSPSSVIPVARDEGLLQGPSASSREKVINNRVKKRSENSPIYEKLAISK
jgi:hypothetical protein